MKFAAYHGGPSELLVSELHFFVFAQVGADGEVDANPEHKGAQGAFVDQGGPLLENFAARVVHTALKSSTHFILF